MPLIASRSKKDIFYLMNKYSGTVSKVEAEILLEYLFNCSRLDLYIKGFEITNTIEELFDLLIERRLGGEPVQYITGRAEFMGMDFIVTKDTLIPRPETEILVNEILVQGSRFKVQGNILDLCTGSGNIAISLAKMLPQVEITATDISESALKIAEKNAARHDVSDRVRFYKGNVFNALVFDKNPKFDIIVCNPPYVEEREVAFLQKEVAAEPEIALNGGKDGLDFYKIIAKESRRYLRKSGNILLEIGFDQVDAVGDIFSSSGVFKIDKIIRDFSGIERAVWISLL